MNVTALARPEIVAMKPYSSARKEAPAQGILLNANEAPRSLMAALSLDGLRSPEFNRYPDPQPAELVDGLARLYEVKPANVLVTRGSDEGIDLLTRVFCRAGTDAILHCPPTFGMYRIAAQTQGAAVVSVQRTADFAMDTRGILDAVNRDERIRIVFLTSPANPTGDCVEESFLRELLAATVGRAIVVVDEAYVEFTNRPSFARWVDDHSQLVVLRTLSKAWASAGLRCGAVIAQPPVIDLLRRVIAPYPLASPVVSLALYALQPRQQQLQRELLSEIRANKASLLKMVESRSFVLKVWPGDANFVLLRVRNAAGILSFCAARGVILRGFPAEPLLGDCIRITVGSGEDLAVLDRVLDEWEKVQS